MKNGDRITGTILSYTQEEIILKTPYGILTIPKVNVARISMEGEKDTLTRTEPEEEIQKAEPEKEVGTGLKPTPPEEHLKIEPPPPVLEQRGSKSTTSAMIYNVIPGGGYFYLGKSGKGLLTLVGETGLAIWGLSLVNEDKKNIGIPLLIGVGLLRIIDFTDVYEESRETQAK